jgi:peroxiredoxin (alkyl hydroperoxide reductase subunit C)
MERLVGKAAPNFKMPAVSGDGNDFIEVKLEDYRGKWLVMFFYPLDFTFVCPTEITGFSKRAEDFSAAGAELLTVSCDSQYSHQAWIKNGLGEIKFPIAADKTGAVSKNYGILIEEEGISLRGLFIIDPEGVVRYSVVHDLNVGRSVDETLRVLKAFQTGGLCALDWSEGEETL